jgi:hypothetical protein
MERANQNWIDLLFSRISGETILAIFTTKLIEKHKIVKVWLEEIPTNPTLSPHITKIAVVPRYSRFALLVTLCLRRTTIFEEARIQSYQTFFRFPSFAVKLECL